MKKCSRSEHLPEAESARVFNRPDLGGIVPISTFKRIPNPDSTLVGTRVSRLQARSQPGFSGKPEGPFRLSSTFIFRNERNWMKKSVWVSENLVSPGLPVL